ncbi:MAG: fructose-bisphosphatase class III [Alphaproteobacteria bacterium]|nr:fructose-bisphosphatase class III [Alphaproteobacteria bacterium]
MNLEYPGLPEGWTGDTVHRLRSDRPVAVIGDIHGSATLLDELLRRLHGRAVIVVGDVGDRGPDTRGVVERLVAADAVGVMGNHDLWLATWAAGEGLDPLALSGAMGGRATLASYATTPEQASERCDMPAAHRRWLLGLHVVIDLDVAGERYWVVHAGIPSDREFEGIELDQVVPWLAEHHAPDLMWRANDPEAMLPVGRPIIMGHQPRPEPLDTGDVIAIDTGAGKPSMGRLTALLLPERKFITVG